MKQRKLTMGVFICAGMCLLLAAGFIMYERMQSVQAEAAVKEAQEDAAVQEQIYYVDVVYTAKRMNKQMKKFQTAVQEGDVLSPSVVESDFNEVQKLIKPLENPPESFTVAYTIAHDMFKYYSTYIDTLLQEEPPVETVEKALADFQLEANRFEQNLILMQNLDQFKGLDIHCH